MVIGLSIPFTGSAVIDIFFITLFTSLFITLVNKYLGDQVRIKALRKEMKSLQKEMRATMTKDPKKAQAMQKEMMKKKHGKPQTHHESQSYACNNDSSACTLCCSKTILRSSRRISQPWIHHFWLVRNLHNLLHNQLNNTQKSTRCSIILTFYPPPILV